MFKNVRGWLTILAQFVRKLYTETNRYHNVRDEQKGAYESKL